MIDIANQAIENMAKIKVLSGELENIRNATKEDLYRLEYDVYRSKIREIEHERDLKMEEVRKKGEAAENVVETDITALNAVVRMVRRILEFLCLDPHKSLDITDEDIQFSDYHRDYYKECVGFYINDTYLKVKLYIIQSEKPVNKYAIVALGKCLFDDNLLKLERYYGMHFHTHDRYEVEKVVRDFPSIDQAKSWLEKNRDKVLSGECRTQYQEVKIAYDKAIQIYKVDDFEDFLLARCECGNFYTIWEDWIKHNEIISCPRCDKQMVLIPRE